MLDMPRKCFEELQKDGKCSHGATYDVTIRCEEMNLKAHRRHLTVASKYFAAMFSHDMKEAQTRVVNFPYSEPKVVRKCIEFLYTGKTKFSLKNPESLIQQADIMELHLLTDRYFRFLMRHLDSINCFEYLELAAKYSLNKFKVPIIKFILYKSEQFASLSVGNVIRMLTIIGGCHTTEALKWRMVVIWIEADLQEREKELESMLPLVNLFCLSREYIGDHVTRMGWLSHNSALWNWVLDTTLSDEYIAEWKNERTMRTTEKHARIGRNRIRRQLSYTTSCAFKL